VRSTAGHRRSVRHTTLNKERIAELSAQLEEFHRTAEEIRITRKTLPELPDPQPSAPSAPKLQLIPLQQPTVTAPRDHCQAPAHTARATQDDHRAAIAAALALLSRGRIRPADSATRGTSAPAHGG
jgi:hypothetical protein